jgi:dynein heavy chain, axonemal
MISHDADDSEIEAESSELDPYLPGPRWLRPSVAHGVKPDRFLQKSDRQLSMKHLAEPKVLLPYETREGQIPRRIQVERQKRNFSNVDINEVLLKKGVIAHLMSTLNVTTKSSIESMSLSIFYNSDYDSQTMETWIDFANQSMLVGRAMSVSELAGELTIEWRPCIITGATDSYFNVEFNNVTGQEQTSTAVKLDRIFICFDAEDPLVYCEHLLDAIQRKSETAGSAALNLYVDCMPMDGLKELNTEQISRILESAINTDILRHNAELDKNAVLQQFNLNHMRTLNQLILTDLLTTHQDEMAIMKLFTTKANLMKKSDLIFPPVRMITTFAEQYFQERVNEFKFNSLWNTPEAVSITLHQYTENYNIVNMQFYASVEKTQRLEEFALAQQNSASTLTTVIKENW